VKRWTERDKRIVWENLETKSIDEIASMLARSKRAIYELMRRNGWLLRRRYTDSEIFIIATFDISQSSGIIKDKTLNAIRIKKWRIKNKSRYKLHKLNQNLKLKKANLLLKKNS